MAGAAQSSSGPGGRSFARGGDELLVGINVTPLVDVVLVLLVVLMVTASYVVSHSLPLDLPKAKSGAAQSGVLHVSIEKDGRVHLDDRSVSDAELRAAARSAVGRDTESRALIAADGSTQHRDVVHVVDLLRESGVDHFAINVRQVDGAPHE
ncbi:MAG: biopolymer transporter ExbD [Myxococcales bacterium]|nr:biopolymer transporter ExbD [Myxococcales bacterium]